MTELVKAPVRKVFSSLETFFGFHHRGVKSLLYHSISDEGDAFSVSAKTFRKQMNYLAQLPNHVFAHAAQYSEKSPAFSISFDDGKRDFLSALPILEEFDIPVYLYVTKQMAQKRDPNYLSESELRDLSRHSLIKLGCHGYTHRNLKSLSPHDLSVELVVPRIWLENLTGIVGCGLALPFGGESPSVLSRAFEAGYDHVATSRLGLNSSPSNIIKRTCVMRRDTESLFRAKAKRLWDVQEWV